MKNIKIISILSILFLTTIFTSCKKKFLYDDINNDPNNIIEATPSLLLPSGQASIAYAQGGDLSRYAGIMTQQYSGAARQFVAINNYNMTDEDFNNVWNTLYSSGMINFQKIIEISDEKGYQYYGGISRVMLAYSAMMTTDLWGNIPFSQAFQGASNLTPSYDNQEMVYSQIGVMLDSAISKLSLPASEGGALKPGVDDLLYGGVTSSWVKFAYALKVRQAIHLTKKGSTVAATKALSYLANAFDSNEDDAQYTFSEVETNSNPWYQYTSQRSDISMSGYLLNELLSTNDTIRMASLIDTTEYIIGPFYGTNNSPVMFITYSEQKFIEAEAQLILGDTISAKLAFKEGIQANFDKLGIEDPSYINLNSNLTGTSDEMLKAIMYQKYVSLFTHPESYTDWRRTGYPILTPNAGTSIPRRFLYPSSENQYNTSNVPSGLTLFSKVWWDN